MLSRRQIMLAGAVLRPLAVRSSISSSPLNPRRRIKPTRPSSHPTDRAVRGRWRMGSKRFGLPPSPSSANLHRHDRELLGLQRPIARPDDRSRRRRSRANPCHQPSSRTDHDALAWRDPAQRHGRRGGVTQPAIQPGETFVYEFELKQNGTQMYHPHSDEMVQMAMGMQGFS